MTCRRAWQRAEQSAAALFGARRRVLSGSAGRDDIDGDDADHPRIHLESKLRAACAIWSLWKATRAAAARRVRAYQGGHKVPVLALRLKHHAGALLVVHQDDFEEVAIEWLAARGQDQLDAIGEAVRLRRMGRGGEQEAV